MDAMMTVAKQAAKHTLIRVIAVVIVRLNAFELPAQPQVTKQATHVARTF